MMLENITLENGTFPISYRKWHLLVFMSYYIQLPKVVNIIIRFTQDKLFLSADTKLLLSVKFVNDKWNSVHATTAR